MQHDYTDEEITAAENEAYRRMPVAKGHEWVKAFLDALPERPQAQPGPWPGQQDAIDAAFRVVGASTGTTLVSSPYGWPTYWPREAPARLAIAQTYDKARPQAAEIAELKAELEKTQAELRKVRKHLEDANRGAERNAHINSNFASQLIEARKQAEQAQAELAVLRQPILADDGRSLDQVYQDTYNYHLAGNGLDGCCDAGVQAVAAVVLAQAVQRMEAVPWRELKFVNYEVVRSRLIAAAKGQGEGQQPIKGLEGLTKERCLRLAEIGGDFTIAAGQPDVCPHAAPHVFCETCKADPCPLGIPKKSEGQAVVVNEPPQDEKQPDLSGESERQDPYAQAQQAEAKPWTPAVGDTVRLKSGGPVMTVHHISKDGSIACTHNTNGAFEFATLPAACLNPVQS